MLGKITIDIKAKDFVLGSGSGFSIEFSKLNVFAGMNGSGKTFIMKCAWVSSYLLQLYKVALEFAPQNTDETFAKDATNVLKYTFDNAEDLNGSIMIQDPDEDIYRLIISFKEGKIDYFNIDILNPAKFSIGNIQNVQFNSKEARTFEQYHKYHKLKEKFGITSLSEESVAEICEFFKLYDVIWFENVRNKLKEYDTKRLEEVNPLFKNNELVSSLGDLFTKSIGDFDLIGINEKDKLPVFELSNGDVYEALDLSSGQQSMLMMMLFV